MTMELNASYGAPFSRKTTGANPETEIAKLLRRSPRASVEKIAERYAEICENDSDLARANAFWVVPLAIQNIKRRAREAELQSQILEDNEKTRAELAKKKIETAERVTTAVVAVRRSFVLEFIMTHTFGELRQMHNANKNIGKIMKMGKPNEYPRDVLGEAKIKKLLGE